MLAGGLYYSWKFNDENFTIYSEAITDIQANPLSEVDPYYYIDGRAYTEEVLNNTMEYYRRYKDLSLIGFGMLYMLNIVDATVDAYMFNYDVSEDLSMNIQPDFINIRGIPAQAFSPIGIKMTFHF